MSKYKITYPVIALVSAVISFFFLSFADFCDVLYVVFYTIAITGLCLLIARIIMHEIDGDNSLQTWQVHVYFAIFVVGWFFACFSTSWLWASIWLCITCSGLVLALGTRYLKDVNGDGIPDIFQDKKKVYSKDWIVRNLLFRFKNDKLGGDLDESKPLILDDSGTPITIYNAEKLGIDTTEAMAYVNNFYV